MVKLAEEDEQMNDRLELYRYRVPQELYHVKRDPDCLENLIEHPNHEKVRNRLMVLLEEWMVQTKDPLLECFQNRDEPALVEAYIQKLEEESNLRRKKEKPSNKTQNSKKKS
jgi:N-sulfoglucosamine sulfohydrolase